MAAPFPLAGFVQLFSPRYVYASAIVSMNPWAKIAVHGLRRDSR